VQVREFDPAAGDPPHVHLVRLAGVHPVDLVAAVDEAGAEQHHVVRRVGRHLLEQ